MMSNWVLKLLVGLVLIYEGTSFEINSTDEERIEGLPDISNQHRSKPVKFLKLVGEGVKFGPGEITITQAESKSWSSSFYSSVTSENSRESSVAVSAGLAIGPFTAGTEVKTGWTKSNSQTTENEKNEAGAFAKSTNDIYDLTDANEFVIKAAEMEMCVFENKNGRPYRIVLPTLLPLQGVYSPEKLVGKNMILDDSFSTLANHFPDYNIKFWTLQQIQDAMVKDGRVIKYDSSYVNTRKWYKIQNWNEEYFLHATRAGVNCVSEDHYNPYRNPNQSPLMWKFETNVDGEGETTYYIKNKSTRGRLFSYLENPRTRGKCHQTQWCFFGAKTGRDKNKLWIITRVDRGEQRYVITHKETGDTLAQWQSDENTYGRKSHHYCGPKNFYCKNNINGEKFEVCDKKILDGDKYWKLIPV